MYDDDKYRQDAFLSWYLRTFDGLPDIQVPQRSSETGSNDGAIAITVSGSSYVIGLLEVKNDGGDALYQALHYVQMLYEVSMYNFNGCTSGQGLGQA